MERIEKDFEGKEFDVVQDGNTEIWTSVDNPAFTFKMIDMEKYQYENACLDLGYGNSSSSIAVIDGGIANIMPVMDKMFLPFFKGTPVGGYEKMGSMQAVCNASTIPNKKYKERIFAARANTGLGALTKYWSQNTYYLSPGEETHGPNSLMCRLRKIKANGEKDILELIKEEINKEYLDINGYARERILGRLNEIISQTDSETFKKDIFQIVKKVSSTEKASKSGDYDAAEMQEKVWVNILKNNPELAEEAQPFAAGFYPWNDFDKESRYARLLSLAADAATTDENRMILLQKRLAYAKQNPHFVAGNEEGLWNAAKKDKQSAKIVIDILRECKDEWNFSEEVGLMEHSPELAKDILPIVAKMYKEHRYATSEYLRPYLTENFDNLKDIILKEPSLMSCVKKQKITEESLKNHELIEKLDSIEKDDLKDFAKVYEDYAAKRNMPSKSDEAALLKSRNIKLEDIGTLSRHDEKIMAAIQKLVLENKDCGAFLVKYSKKFPNFVEDTVKYLDNPYVHMCINNFENPEKENIKSVLNRLHETEAKNYDEFSAAVDFVHRRDMCRKVCKDFAAENEHYVDDGQLSYGMAEAGVDSRETAKKIAELFFKFNERPSTYGSSYNEFYPDQLVKIAEASLEDWMIPVVKKAIDKGMVRMDNLGGGRELFAACKAWKINSKMPKAVAEQVGEMPLAKRMIAGAITEKLSASLDEGMNYHKELIPEFWKEMSHAQEMTFSQAMQTYIPDNKINRKRFVAAMLEEMRVENSSEKFKLTYRRIEEAGKFEEFLAPRGISGNDNLSEKAEKLVRIKQNKENVQNFSTKKKSIRERLTDKGLLPESGKFGEGHQINVPVKDMSVYKVYVR